MKTYKLIADLNFSMSQVHRIHVPFQLSGTLATIQSESNRCLQQIGIRTASNTLLVSFCASREAT
jgi:hypothetical protein